jgi:hypothetical protein
LLNAADGRPTDRRLPRTIPGKPRRGLNPEGLLVLLLGHELLLVNLLRQELQPVLNLLELLRHDPKQLLETVKLLLLQVIQLGELMREILQQLLQRLHVLLRLQPEWLRRHPVEGYVLERLQIWRCLQREGCGNRVAAIRKQASGRLPELGSWRSDAKRRSYHGNLLLVLGRLVPGPTIPARCRDAAASRTHAPWCAETLPA